MTRQIPITFIGNLTADPELRTIGSGAQVVNFTVASTERKYDKAKGQWSDAGTVFMRVAAWRKLATNSVASLTKGMRVIVVGTLKQRTYETSAGETRTVTEMTADAIGPDLTSGTARVSKSSSKEAPAYSAPPVSGFVPDDVPASDDPSFDRFAA